MNSWNAVPISNDYQAGVILKFGSYKGIQGADFISGYEPLLEHGVPFFVEPGLVDFTYSGRHDIDSEVFQDGVIGQFAIDLGSSGFLYHECRSRPGPRVERSSVQFCHASCSSFWNNIFFEPKMLRVSHAGF